MVGYESAYIFRGVKFGDNLYEAGVTVPIKLGDKLTLNLLPWYGMLGEGAFGDGDYSELDLGVSLNYDLGFGVLGLGYTFYYYPDSGWDTHEPNITFAKSFGGLNWTIGAYLDTNANGGDPILGVDGKEGWYFETAVEYPIKVSESFSIVPSAKISYVEDYYTASGFNNLLLKLSLPYKVTSALTVAPFVAGSIALDGLDEIGVDDYLVGGVFVTYSF